MAAPLEIFRPGSFTASNGRKIDFSEADVRGIAESYDPARHEAPLVIGHPAGNDPAWGWVRSVDFSAGVLAVEPHQVDPEFQELVNAGRYKKISMSVYEPTSPQNPVPGSYYLRHVGFLGAQAPAVKGLRSAEFAAGDREGVLEFGDYEDLTVARLLRQLREFLLVEFGQEKADAALPSYMIEGIEADALRPEPEAAQPSFSEERPGDGGEEQRAVQEPGNTSPAVSDVGSGAGGGDGAGRPSETNNSADAAPPLAPPERGAVAGNLTDPLAERAEELRRREAKLAVQERLAQLNSFCEELEQGGRLLPVDRPGVVSFLASLDGAAHVEFGENGQLRAAPALDWFKDYLRRQPRRVEFAELTGGALEEVGTADFQAPAGAEVRVSQMEIYARAKAHQASHPGVEWLAAVKAVQR
jgi:hypothetical protein